MGLRKAVDENDANDSAVQEEALPKVDSTDHEAAAKAEVKSEVKEVAVKPKAGAVKLSKEPKFFKTSDIVEQIIADAVPGDYATIVATGGTFKISGVKADIGAQIEFYVLGMKRRFAVSTGDSGDESKEYFTTAYEGDMGKDGKSIDEWVDDAKAAGYDKARKAEYLDLFVEVIDHSSTKVEDIRGESCAVLQLSFMSTKKWKRFADGLKIKCGWGEEVPWGDGFPKIKATATPASNSKGKDYTEFAFSLVE